MVAGEEGLMVDGEKRGGGGVVEVRVQGLLSDG